MPKKRRGGFGDERGRNGAETCQAKRGAERVPVPSGQVGERIEKGMDYLVQAGETDITLRRRARREKHSDVFGDGFDSRGSENRALADACWPADVQTAARRGGVVNEVRFSPRS
jgi:hypothetical protein